MSCGPGCGGSALVWCGSRRPARRAGTGPAGSRWPWTWTASTCRGCGRPAAKRSWSGRTSTSSARRRRSRTCPACCRSCSPSSDSPRNLPHNYPLSARRAAGRLCRGGGKAWPHPCRGSRSRTSRPGSAPSPASAAWPAGFKRWLPRPVTHSSRRSGVAQAAVTSSAGNGTPGAQGRGPRPGRVRPPSVPGVPARRRGARR